MDKDDVKTAKADSDGKKTLDSAFAMIRKMKERMDKIEGELETKLGIKVEGSAKMTVLFALGLVSIIAISAMAADLVWRPDDPSGSQGTCKVETAGGAETLTVDKLSVTTIVGGGIVTNIGPTVTGGTFTGSTNVNPKMTGTMAASNVTASGTLVVTGTINGCPANTVTQTVAGVFTNVYVGGVLFSHNP